MPVLPAVEGTPTSPRTQVTIHRSTLSQMHRTQSQPHKSKRLKRKEGLGALIVGVSRVSGRATRRLCCKLQLWMWRKRREKCRFSILRAKRLVYGTSSGSGLSVKTQSRKSKGSVVSPRRRDSGCSEDTLGGRNCQPRLRQSVCASDTFACSTSSQSLTTDTNVSTGDITVPAADTSACLSGITDPSEGSLAVKPALSTEGDTCRSSAHFKEPWTPVVAPGVEVHGPSGQPTAGPRGQEKTANITDEGINRTKAASPQTDLDALTKDIREFLDGFYRTHGSFIPLEKSDVLRHLKRRFNTDFSGWKNVVFSEVAKYQSVCIQEPVPSFRVVYKKHTLTLDDLSTLADHSWLNDQVMNMYGELITDSVDGKVHFLNSFFHRQLMTKGYDGVKRWTKKVDLFSKRLLLAPIHLEVHWCLVTADNVEKKICLYDSQGNALQKVARNILKYLMAEAKEKKQTAFEKGWIMSYDEKIPQQTNENDCGVFVLEYSRRLALGKTLQFSQKDIPKIRRRIYKELCDCKLHEQA